MKDWELEPLQKAYKETLNHIDFLEGVCLDNKRLIQELKNKIEGKDKMIGLLLEQIKKLKDTISHNNY